MSERLPAVDDLEIIQGADYIEAYSIWADDFDTGAEVLVNTTGFNAQFTVRVNADGGQLLFMSVGNSYIGVGYDPPRFEAAHAYVVGDYVIPLTMNGYIYKVTTAGTSGGSSPTWPTTIGQTVANGAGALVFTCIATDETVTNLRLYFTHTLTDALEDWGIALYDLKLFDTLDNRSRQFEGNAIFSSQMTQ